MHILFNQEGGQLMELISMLFALIFMALFVMGSLIHAYYYEIRYFNQQLVQRFSRLLPIRKMHNDPES